ncbi:MMPL family protein [Bremerella volcania]|uniref:MMPL family protein n=1 Tax=Bremerella volcania TaxID=2527984 RepID=A0A518CF34_9BACT|nr:MMPL family transporter [Bremerella volcania]QDU77843.1 MMPL family protein [Bremerella volcania]
MKKLFERWIALRWLLLAVGIALTVGAVYLGQGLSFDRSIENMFAAEDPLIQSHERFNRIFGGNEVILGVYKDDQLFAVDGTGLDKVRAVRTQIEALDGVKEVLSLDRKLTRGFVLDPESDAGIKLKELFAGYTHNRDGNIVALPIQLTPKSETTVSRVELIGQVRAIFDGLPGGMITGEPVMVVDGFKYVEEDGDRLGWATSLLLAAVILLVFRNIRWMIIAIVVVQVTLQWTHAALAVSGLQLSMVSSMLTAIVTVIGVATVVHYILRFRQYRDEGQEPKEALASASAYLLAPVFWACATDAVGFSALLITSVGPVHDFGIMMAVGAMLVLPAVLVFLPGLVLAGSPWIVDPASPWGDAKLSSGLSRTINSIVKRPVILMVLILLAFAVSLWGAARLRVESDFTKNFRETTPIVQAYAFVEDELGGAGVWDVAIPAPEHLTWEYIQEVQALEDRLRTEVPELSKVLSLADVVSAMMEAAEKKSPFRLPKYSLMRVGMGLLRDQLPETLNSLYSNDPENPDEYWFRIMLLSKERQDAQTKQETIEAVRRVVADFYAQKQAEAKVAEEDGEMAVHDGEPIVSGFFVLLTHLIDSLIRDQWESFALAIAGIGVTMTLAFRSLKMALLALIPNILPILMVTGAFGLLGYRINMGAAMIAAVSMGLGVDASIHYIYGFQRSIAGGLTPSQALVEVQQSVGKAVIFATFALIAGFSVLCVSDFVPTIYFGVLVGLTMLGALVGNLIILPLLIKLLVIGRTEPQV